MIERIGLENFLDGIEEDVDVNMVAQENQVMFVLMIGMKKKKWYEKADERHSA